MNVPKPPSSSDSDSSGAQESDVASISVPSDAPYGFEIILQQLKRGHNRDASKSPLSSDSKSDHQLSDVSSASSASEARILEGRSSVETPKFPYASDSESDYQSRQVVDHRSFKTSRRLPVRLVSHLSRVCPSTTVCPSPPAHKP